MPVTNELELKEYLQNILDNGLDVSSFKFLGEEDSNHFFTVFGDYLELFSKPFQKMGWAQNPKTEITSDMGCNVWLDDMEICFLKFSDDMKTVQCVTFHDLSSKQLVFVLRTLIETMEELVRMITHFASLISKLEPPGAEDVLESLKQSLTANEIKPAPASNKNIKKKGKPPTLVSKETYNSINKIKKIQKYIDTQTKKYDKENK